ncbi:MAG TPA: tetratricopeptide repeat protein, partial [Kofleriaceae bacterium]|nr:tetratricopeptide repeat protein [Kofleriaceae bacterium]
PGLPSTPKPEPPAPKGYFDDIPGLPSTPKPEVPAPKGFFDDIPGLPSTPKPESAPPGYFDDIPGLPSTPKPESAPRGFFEDRPPPGRAVAERPDGDAVELQLAAGPEPDVGSLPASASPPVAARSSGTFDDLDLSRPSAPVRFESPTRPSAPRAVQAEARNVELGPVLELETPRPGAAPPVARRPGKDEPAARPGADRRTRKRAAIVVLIVIAALAAGGFAIYRRRVAMAERRAAISEQLMQARSAYAASDARHWQRAAAAAHRVVELDETNPEALGIGAEALLAGALDDGTGASGKIAQAHAMLDTASTNGISSTMLTRARALAALAAHQPDTALQQLPALTGKASEDGALALYTGWARAARGDATGAIQAYDLAINAPGARLSALYGRGNARLELADLDDARADFAKVLELAKDHIGAQVGLAAAQPPAAAQRREADLLAILARKDIPAADPRAVARAWTLAGDAAMRAGRYDVARDRFRKALGLTPDDLGATAALAETELRDNKLGFAAGLTSKALAVSKDNVAAQLVQSEIEVKQSRFQIAGQRLDALAARTPPLAPLELARLQVVRGKLADAQGDGQGAADAYIKAAQVARDLDLEPMVAAVSKLAALTRTAIGDHDAARADALRKRTDELLGNFASQAARDPQLALTLGISYLQAGNADKAEPWLHRAVEALPQDAEARFQLGRALLVLDRPQEALDALRAALSLGPSRLDITAELAHSYEALQRDTDAAALYDKLLAGPDPGLELRARAGRFYARTGAIDKAAAQGEKILAADPHDASGHYLRGEGMLKAGKLLEARQQFQRAVEADRDPQYLDALGRAAEAIGNAGDRDAQELALRSYAEADDASAHTLVNPLVGQGRLYLLRHEAVKAVPHLSAAVRLDSHNAEALLLLGAAYQDSQRPADARRWLGEAVKIAATPEAYWRIAQLERDANHGPAAILALTSAIRLAGDAEKTGKTVAWLTDALYLLGRVNLDLRNEPAARDAWQLYVARHPPASAQLTEVKQLLATTLSH